MVFRKIASFVILLTLPMNAASAAFLLSSSTKRITRGFTNSTGTVQFPGGSNIITSVAVSYDGGVNRSPSSQCISVDPNRQGDVSLTVNEQITLKGPGFSLSSPQVTNSGNAGGFGSGAQYFDCPLGTGAYTISDPDILAAYFGSQSVNVTFSDNVSIGTSGRGIVNYNPPQLPVTLSYYGFTHASPALSASGATIQSLDLGSVLRGSAPVTKSFSIFNLGTGTAASLDLTSVQTFNPKLTSISTNLAPFSNQIGGGASRDYTVTLNTRKTGLFLQRYALRFSDAAGGVGGRSYGEQYLFVSGSVIARTANVNVPEPATFVLFAAMLAGITLRFRRARPLVGS